MAAYLQEILTFATRVYMQEPLHATAFSDKNLVNAQKSDRSILKVIDFIKDDHRPSAQLIDNHHLDKRFLRDWDKLYIEDGIFCRRGILDDQSWNQLVFPHKLYGTPGHFSKIF